MRRRQCSYTPIEDRKARDANRRRVVPRKSTQGHVRAKWINRRHGSIRYYAYPVVANPQRVDQGGTEDVILLQRYHFLERRTLDKRSIKVIRLEVRSRVIGPSSKDAVLIRKLVVYP